MRTVLFTILISLILSPAFAQITISGTVKDRQQHPLPGASISIEHTYYGATAGENGAFSFTAPLSGPAKIVISITGYYPYEQMIAPDKSPVEIQAVLRERISELKAVTITAGSFEASDKKRTSILKSVDIVTTAGQQADIVAALKTLPGAQQVGETEGLFVRGGSGSETRVFIDGLMVNNPFFSNVPDIAQRGRFSPLLFKGTNFSSGGYSAQYGQGLSSALQLESQDLPSRTESNWIISSAQLSVTGQKLYKSGKSSIGGSVTYSNLAPYFGVVPQKVSYPKAPEIINSEFFARRKTKNGMLKLYGYAGYNTIAFSKPAIGNEQWQQQFRLFNNNAYTNITYNGKLNSAWKWYAGGSISLNKDDVRVKVMAGDTLKSHFSPQPENLTTQAKTVFTRSLGTGLNKLYIGAEWQYMRDHIFAEDSIPSLTIKDHYTAAFAETDIYLSASFTTRLGVRWEYSGLLGQGAVSPRASLAWKIDGRQQVSAAYGDFCQKPETNYLFRNQQLLFGKATHYILNYMYQANDRLLRVEAFYKGYHRLVTYPVGKPALLSSDGSGYAQGFEVFWRDKRSIRGFDYWISYSYLDTKRQYLDYPFKVQPGFAATHTASVVAKKYVAPVSTYISTTYTFASGRPYYNPNRPLQMFMQDRTIDYHTLGLQLNYLTQFRNVYAVFIFNMSNVIGNQQIYTWRFAGDKGADGLYRGEAVTPMAKRFFFIGCYLSMGMDRRKTFID